MKEETKNVLTIVGVVILILLITYLCTAFFLTGEIGNNNEKQTTTTSSQSSLDSQSSDDTQTTTTQAVTSEYKNMILASKTFSQKEDKYMVLFYSNKAISEAMKTLITNYDSSSNDVKLYKVNYNEAINSYVVADEENKDAQSASELKITKTTLVTIENGSIISYTSDNSEILNSIK